MGDLSFRDVNGDTWSDFEALFEARGGPRYCWCMAWRATSAEAKQSDNDSRKAMIKGRVDSGVPIGILAYKDGKPVGWCSVAPRATYRPQMADHQPGDDDEVVWSVVCFFVVRAERKQGTMQALLDAASEHARRCGATVVEGYPVDPDSPSYRFGGFVDAFEGRGFVEIGRAGSRRHVVRLSLGDKTVKEPPGT
jgi:GNAT superfamily N-acetyltransferase